MLPRVAVLLSTYNGARFLEEQLESLRAQRGVEVVLHVRDDGSTDETLDVLARHADRWPSLASVPSGPNLGPAASFLELLRTAPDDADYYAFCDQDDVWLPEKLGRAVSFIGGDDGPALYCSNVTCVDEELNVLGVPRENGDPRFEHLLFENIAYGCTTVMNRAARMLISSQKPQQGMIMHDWWCALVTAAFGQVVFDSRPAILYRQHGTNSVGASPRATSHTLRQLAAFAKNPRRYYPIHAQACEFNRVFGASLGAPDRYHLRTLVDSKQRLPLRIRLAFSAHVIRSRLSGNLFARGLILTGWY